MPGLIADTKEIVSRIGRYLTGGGSVIQLPIGEVMLTCKLHSMDEDWVQKFVPFINVSIMGIGSQSPRTTLYYNGIKHMVRDGCAGILNLCRIMYRHQGWKKCNISVEYGHMLYQKCEFFTNFHKFV